MAKRPVPQRERFFRHVTISDGCWDWRGYKLPSGKGQFDDRLAHHVAYELSVGPIPPGMRVVHKCENAACTNPNHLVLTDEPFKRGVRAKSLADKFEKGVIRRDGCWGWRGYKHRFGYGYIHDRGRLLYAHRVAFEMFVGSIPKGMSILHVCDNPECTNPNHLRAGTQADNMVDMKSKGRQQKGDLHYASKLKDDDMVDIRVLRAFGLSYAKIGRAYGVGPSAVRARMMSGG